MAIFPTWSALTIALPIKSQRILLFELSWCQIIHFWICRIRFYTTNSSVHEYAHYNTKHSKQPTIYLSRTPGPHFSVVYAKVSCQWPTKWRSPIGQSTVSVAATCLPRSVNGGSNIRCQLQNSFCSTAYFYTQVCMIKWLLHVWNLKVLNQNNIHMANKQQKSF